MSKKENSLIIEPGDFHVYLKAWMGANGYQSVEQLAVRLGVSRELVYMLLTGSRKPSAAILEKVGLETVFRAVAPAKSKK